MADARGQSGDPDDGHLDLSPTSDAVHPEMTMHPVFPALPLHMYPFANGLTPRMHSKRRQVKNACTNCQKACKKCDEARPCLRCVKYGIGEECVDSQRKERKKGIKRGPYRKRDRKTTNVEQPLDVAAVAVHQGVPPPGVPTASPPLQVPYMGYPPGYYGQYAAPTATPTPSKPGEAHAYYPHPHSQYYVPLQHPQQQQPFPPPPPTHEQQPDNVAYYAPPQFYPSPFMPPYAKPYSYMMPQPCQRPDHMPPMYQKPHPGAPGQEDVVGYASDAYGQWSARRPYGWKGTSEEPRHCNELGMTEGRWQQTAGSVRHALEVSGSICAQAARSPC
ncbi:hypothetical protein FA95DRAFT_1296898 [Auriscalpium vulgare]|uniref:Uncharacterized protein n=1 Tax=Auriscalpium vulgare TaxID=40419 RepID=A0ACB8RT43_9AGAM|nr:hypothetical protein FA95DRAFT_1296898 [Auriscalpium vulgare]